MAGTTISTEMVMVSEKRQQANQAIKCLQKAKEREKREKLIPIKINDKTIILCTKEKIERLGVQNIIDDFVEKTNGYTFKTDNTKIFDAETD